MTRALTSASLVGLLVFGALAGCGSIPPSAYTAVVAPLSCTPESQVNIGATVNAGTASVMVAEPTNIDSRGGGIRWNLHGLAGQNVAFANNGIIFNAGAPPGGPGPGNSSQYVWCFGTSTYGTRWKYTIQFVDPAVPTKVWSCDPTVVSSGTGMQKADERSFECF